ncbi:MAG: bifunctional folylpolyglutamate synthase/dihydrofolate synthase [Muribaculaceae bacterium]|nr:bifunctional folylpolyglutamate synthase/dihydrofolate synthase [Muribaculaceae bacterium]
MNYQQTIDFLYNQRPAFERQGASGYKPGLQNAIALDNWLGNPHMLYPTIHVAGTNGKGSVANMLAAILQNNGYRVGLFTSPHFVDFRERIRVNGEMISKDFVVKFVDRFNNWNYSGQPSFFELTSAMALDYFAVQKVDYAIIEVGLGGRLDSTNIITPILSIITNISIDHTEFLGNTIEEIASEKAGIIKAGTPAIVGEAEGSVRDVFTDKANSEKAQITFVTDNNPVIKVTHNSEQMLVETTDYGTFPCELQGDYQKANIATVLTAVNQLKSIDIALDDSKTIEAFNKVSTLTGLRGRWTKLGSKPDIIADSAHNVAGITAAMHQLAQYECDKLHMVIGFMADKDLAHILPLLPREATYYITQAHTSRALTADKLKALTDNIGLNSKCYPDVGTALAAARKKASSNDLIYVGGSMYVLSELFSLLDNENSML